MTFEDYLLPGEEVRYYGSSQLEYGGKPYDLIITDRRLLLYSRRGMLFKNDDTVTLKLDEIQNIMYRENGILKKEGILEIHARTKFSLSGSAAQVKAVYQQILLFF